MLLAAEILRPPPQRTADQWADAKRILPAGSTAEPGPWNSDRVPYTRAICRAFADPAIDAVIAVMGTQQAKSETALNVVGWRLDDDPAPVLYVGPTQKLTKTVSRDRIIKLFRSVDSLWSKLEKGKRNQITEKYVAGVRLGFAWATSATEMSGNPAALVILDELDRMPVDVEGEGDPFTLGQGRTPTFPDGTVGAFSSPTIEGASPIWALFESGTMMKWAWPCPSCKQYFVPCLDRVKWDGHTPAEAAASARVQCPHCEHDITDAEKYTVNNKGEYIPHECVLDADGAVVEHRIVDVPIETSIASFWVSGLASPWRTISGCVRRYIEAVRKGDRETIQAVINTVFGETFRVKGEAPEWSAVAQLRDLRYVLGEAPDGVQLITAGVDVQKNRLVVAVRGWGYNQESWLIEADELFGETEFDEVWVRLGKMLAKQYESPIGPLRVAATFVDSGYHPGDGARSAASRVYAFCRRHAGAVWPSKGRDRSDKPLVASQLDVKLGTLAGSGAGLTLFHVDTDHFKSFVYGRMEWPVDQPGGFHLPRNATDDYLKQITAEEVVTKRSGKRIWIRRRKANHFLDCEVLCAAAATFCRAQDLPEWAPVLARAQVEQQTVKDQKSLLNEKTQSSQPWVHRKSGWLDRD